MNAMAESQEQALTESAAAMSSNSNTNGAGGVRNLRAMFENKGTELSTSPPSRGRSPSNSVSSVHSRPVSKVRTSFVAVERPGEQGGPPQWGLRKTSEMDGIIEGDEPGLGAILKGSPFESEFPRADRAVLSQSNNATSEQPKPHNATTKSNGSKVQDLSSIKTQSPGVIQPPKAAPAKQVMGKATAQPDSKKSPITPTGNGPLVKPRGGVAKIQGVIESANKAKEARLAVSGSNEAPTKSETADHSKNDSITSPRTIKPPRQSLQPKLATKPVRSQGSATAPTAASVAKHETETKPAEHKATVRGPPRVANATTASSLAKQQSRASLDSSDKPKSRPSMTRTADEGFLARMMRPTTSSAQKTHDKVQSKSPPHSRRTSDIHKQPTKKSTRRSVAPTGIVTQTVQGNMEDGDLGQREGSPSMPEVEHASSEVLQASEQGQGQEAALQAEESY